jgi:C4-dicarboxylate-specific signal transduction histidine kinase
MLLISLILLAVIVGPLYFLIKQLDKNYDEYSINMVEITSNLVYQSVYDGMLLNDEEMIQRNLELFSLEPSVSNLRIFNRSGKILYSSKKSEIDKNILDFNRNIKPGYLNGEEQETFYKSKQTYYHLHPIYVQQECTPCHTNQGELIAVMDVQLGLSQSEKFYSSAKNLTIVSAIFIVILLWIILNFLYEKQIESRLKIIMEGFNNLSLGNLNFSLKIPGRHELALLAKKFNQTVSKLKEAKDKEDKFILENLERADRLVTLGEVAAEIAHEVNNPASIILTRAEIIRQELHENSVELSVLDDIDMIIQQTSKIAEITKSILYYARKLPQKFTETDLNFIIQQSLKILEPRINKRNVNIEYIPYNSPAIVNANSSQLVQVFCNLINNSLDVIEPNRGVIKIEIQQSNGTAKSAGFRIIYRDNGPGIRKEIREKIFNPFFTTKSDGKGTGLGLFIVKNIITYHHGSIYVSDENKSGAVFIIEIGNNGSNN